MPGPVGRFVKAYIKTMRLYYAFITGITGWIGVSFYFFVKHREFAAGRWHEDVTDLDWYRGIVVLTILFLSWGINQVYNDWLGIEEDKINAPHRPMVTGELNVKWALVTSYTLMGVAAVATCFMNPWALIPLIAGFLLNFVYEYSKAWGIWANVIFGIMIAMCAMYGFMAIGPTPSEHFFTTERMSGLILIAFMNGLMTYFTYFKDYEGDKAAGKDTYIVRHGIEYAKKMGIVATFMPTLIFFGLRFAGLWPFEITNEFIFCGVMTIFLQFWTAIRFYNKPMGPRAYFSNATNFRACACGQVAIIAIFNGTLALYLFNFTYIFIGFLFGLYDDPKS